MKTIAYNPEREILTALLTLILSFCILTAVKAQGNSGPQPANESKKDISEDKTGMMAARDAASTKASENSLALKIESWMNNGSYWDETSDDQSSDTALALKIEKWMSDGSFWSTDINDKTDLDKLAMFQNEVEVCDAKEDAGN